jgi:2'-5' RNA ligase
MRQLMLPANALIRRQVSMYLSGVPDIVALRFRYNRAQAELIPPHVTLCREDEVDDWSALQIRIREILPVHVTLGFGGPVRKENLVYLPAITGTRQFDELRSKLLSANGREPRKHSPHITIIHPRNGICTDEIFEEIALRIRPFAAAFRAISLIEQSDGGPWKQFAELGSDDAPMV